MSDQDKHGHSDPSKADLRDDADRNESPGLREHGTRTRSHAHGGRRGRAVVHGVMVVLAAAAITLAAQFPGGDAGPSEQETPSFAISGVAGSLRLDTSESLLAPGSSTRTLSSVAILTRERDLSSMRAAGGVAPTSSFSSGVSAAAADIAAGDGGPTPLADVLDPTQPYTVYVTQPGDSVSTIASQFEIEIGTILDNNPTVADRNLIQAGLELLIPRTDGILHRVGFGETVGDIVRQYDNITADTVVGFRPNAIGDPDSLEPGSTILLPGARQKPPAPAPTPVPQPTSPPAPTQPQPSQPQPTQPPQGAAPAPQPTATPVPANPPPSSGGGRFSNPLAAYSGVSDPFGTYRGEGRIHGGIDLDLWGYPSSPVYSACDGVVSRTEYWTYSYGYHVVVDCGDGFSTLYAHFSQIDVSPGQAVSAGTRIGVSGLTGFTTGEHLHFEIRVWGAPVDPAQYINF